MNEQSNGPDGGQDTTLVVVLVQRPDGTSQVINFRRKTPLPVEFKLNDCERVSSVENKDVPGRLQFFFDKIDGSSKSKKEVKATKPEEGLENE